LEFNNETAPEMLVQMYENNEAPAVIINSNFALDGGLNPQEDSIAPEDSDSPYANLVAVREGDQDRDDIKKLMEVLQGDEIKQFIEENDDGAVTPAEQNRKRSRQQIARLPGSFCLKKDSRGIEG